MKYLLAVMLRWESIQYLHTIASGIYHGPWQTRFGLGSFRRCQYIRIKWYRTLRHLNITIAKPTVTNTAIISKDAMGLKARSTLERL